MRVLAAVALAACAHTASTTASRLVYWGKDATADGMRFWVFRGDAAKNQTFALYDQQGLVGTARVIAVEQPYADKPCFRIAHADAGTMLRSPANNVVAFGPVAGIPPDGRAVTVDLHDARASAGLDLDGDGVADLAFAGPDCPEKPDGYHWCIDSYVRTKGRWIAVEHFAESEGCR